MRVISEPQINSKERKYYARVGDFFGPLRSNANEALAALDKELEYYHPLNHTYVRCGDGTVLHLLQVPSHGWSYRIIGPAGYEGKGVGVNGTHAECLARAQDHAKREFGGVV